MADEHVRVRMRRGDWEFEAEGPQAFVEAQLADAESKFQSSLRVPVVTSSTPVATEPSSRTLARIRVKEFVDQKSPKGHLEVIPTLAYWARENESLVDLGREDLERLYKLAEVRRPTDPRNAMAQVASQKAWLENAGNGRYRLTAAGEDFVTLDLPRKK